jgi:hypothetical protein
MCYLKEAIAGRSIDDKRSLNGRIMDLKMWVNRRKQGVDAGRESYDGTCCLLPEE